MGKTQSLGLSGVLYGPVVARGLPKGSAGQLKPLPRFRRLRASKDRPNKYKYHLLSLSVIAQLWKDYKICAAL